MNPVHIGEFESSEGVSERVYSRGKLSFKASLAFYDLMSSTGVCLAEQIRMGDRVSSKLPTSPIES